MNTDGLHLSGQGGRLLADLIIPILEKILGVPSIIFPHYDEMNYAHPETHFQGLSNGNGNHVQ